MQIKFLPFLFLSILFSCREEVIPLLDPCATRIELETIKPIANGLSWIPYQVNEEIQFTNTKNEKVVFKVVSFGQFIESPTQSITIPCDLDSSKSRVLNYKEGSYQTELKRVAGVLPSIKSFQISLVSYYNQFNPLKYGFSDILEVHTSAYDPINESQNILNFFILVLDRNTNEKWEGHQFNPTLLLGNKIFQNVYFSLFSESAIQVYYTKDGGIIGFKDQDAILWLRD